MHHDTRCQGDGRSRRTGGGGVAGSVAPSSARGPGRWPWLLTGASTVAGLGHRGEARESSGKVAHKCQRVTGDRLRPHDRRERPAHLAAPDQRRRRPAKHEAASVGLGDAVRGSHRAGSLRARGSGEALELGAAEVHDDGLGRMRREASEGRGANLPPDGFALLGVGRVPRERLARVQLVHVTPEAGPLPVTGGPACSWGTPARGSG